MGHYKRKPFEVDAAQLPDREDWLKYRSGHTVAIQSLVALGELFRDHQTEYVETDIGIMVTTLNGNTLAEPGMWILRDPQSHFHVMAAEAFAAAYEATEN